jgi:hypothetical protein
MIIEFFCKSKEHSRFFKASGSHIAANRFLNYLRRYTKDRPSQIIVAENINNRLRDKYTYAVEWYIGPKREGLGKDVVGEWYSLSGPIEIHPR